MEKLKNCNKEKHNNKGFSLLELIIVVAIMAVIIGIMVVSMTVVAKGNAKKAAKNLYNSINTLRFDTMSVNADWYMIITKDSKGYKFTTYKDKGDETGSVYKVLNAGASVNIQYIADDSDGNASHTTTDLTSDTFENMEIKFRKDTGAFEYVKVNGRPVMTGTKGTFKVTSGNSEHQVTLWYKTGRITTVN